MSTVSVPRRGGSPEDLPPLYNGDRLSQAEFHRRYEAYREDVKFELIGGIVYMVSPLRRAHSRYHALTCMLLRLYETATPGVETLDNATTILGEESEPQPDLVLRIRTDHGGQSQETPKDYVEGPPELVVEIAHSTEAIDLHQKRLDYQEAGVLEYLVVCLHEQELHWFHFKSRRRISADVRGIFRSRVFPGLWIDSPALFALDGTRGIEVLQQGLASPEHAAFVRSLRGRRAPGSS